MERIKNYRSYALQLGSLILVLIGFKLFSIVLMWNETRTGYGMRDIVLDHFGPYENHLPIFILTYGLVVLGLWHSLRTKEGWINTQFSILFFMAFRTITLTLFPLDPPEKIIPLQDLFLTNTFYCSKTLVRDLFFSGHTCAVFLLFFLVDTKWVKYILLVGGFLLGTLLILQHVHWTVDVLAAPFFAFMCYKCGSFVQRKISARFGQEEDFKVVVD